MIRRIQFKDNNELSNNELNDLEKFQLQKLVEFYYSIDDKARRRSMIKHLSESQENIEQIVNIIMKHEAKREGFQSTNAYIKYITEELYKGKNLRDYYHSTANDQRKNGAKTLIREDKITVVTPSKVEYFLNGHEAKELLNEVPYGVSSEDYILAISKSWE